MTKGLFLVTSQHPQWVASSRQISLCQRVLDRGQESIEKEKEEEEIISSSQTKGSLGDLSHPSGPPGTRSQQHTPSPMPSQLQQVRAPGAPHGMPGAQHLSQHTRHKCCSPLLSNPPKTGLFFPCLEARQPSAHPDQGHPHSQHAAWPGLLIGETRISVGTNSGATDQPVEGPTSILVALADQGLTTCSCVSGERRVLPPCRAPGTTAMSCTAPLCPRHHSVNEAGRSGQCHLPNVISKGSPYREGQGLWGCLPSLWGQVRLPSQKPTATASRAWDTWSQRWLCWSPRASSTLQVHSTHMQHPEPSLCPS